MMISRVEEILDAIITDESYDKKTYSEIESAFVNILNNIPVGFAKTISPKSSSSEIYSALKRYAVKKGDHKLVIGRESLDGVINQEPSYMASYEINHSEARYIWDDLEVVRDGKTYFLSHWLFNEYLINSFNKNIAYRIGAPANIELIACYTSKQPTENPGIVCLTRSPLYVTFDGSDYRLIIGSSIIRDINRTVDASIRLYYSLSSIEDINGDDSSMFSGKSKTSTKISGETFNFSYNLNLNLKTNINRTIYTRASAKYTALDGTEKEILDDKIITTYIPDLIKEGMLLQ